MKVRNVFSFLGDGILIFLFVYLLVFPQYASEPTRGALAFCAQTLIPSLFIYMVLAKTVISLPITEKISKYTGLAPLVLITGTLCGCPIGAKTAVSLYENGRINKKYAEYLCSFSNNASVSFLLGYVGSELFGDIYVGIRLLIYQLTSSVITAAVMRVVLFGREKPPKAMLGKSAKTGLREAVSDSALTMLNLCACVIFFIVAGGVLVNLFSLSSPWDAVLKSLLEFSSGCAAAAKTGAFALPITAFSVGLTGFSVALQVRSVTAGRLSIRPFFAGKIISCGIMTALAVIFG